MVLSMPRLRPEATTMAAAHARMPSRLCGCGLHRGCTCHTSRNLRMPRKQSIGESGTRTAGYPKAARKLHQFEGEVFRLGRRGLLRWTVLVRNSLAATRILQGRSMTMPSEWPSAERREPHRQLLQLLRSALPPSDGAWKPGREEVMWTTAYNTATHPSGRNARRWMKVEVCEATMPTVEKDARMLPLLMLKPPTTAMRRTCRRGSAGSLFTPRRLRLTTNSVTNARLHSGLIVLLRLAVPSPRRVLATVLAAEKDAKVMQVHMTGTPATAMRRTCQRGNEGSKSTLRPLR